MKPAEIAKLFADYIEQGTTPKGLKVQSFFNQLPDSQKKAVANNVSKAFEAYQKAEEEKAEMRKKRKKEIAELKKKAKELGLTLVDE
jgi:peptidyl-tRNA hydrolase